MRYLCVLKVVMSTELGSQSLAHSHHRTQVNAEHTAQSNRWIYACSWQSRILTSLQSVMPAAYKAWNPDTLLAVSAVHSLNVMHTTWTAVVTSVGEYSSYSSAVSFQHSENHVNSIQSC